MLSIAGPGGLGTSARADESLVSGVSESGPVSLALPQILVQSDANPDPVTLYEPIDVTADSVRLLWTRSNAENFSRYLVYASNSPTPYDCGCSIMDIIYDQNDTDCRIDNLEPDRKYYFAVRVVDTVGKYSTSNVTTARTLPADLEPPSLLLLSPLNTTYGVSNVALTYRVDASTEWTMYSLDSRPNATIQSNTTLLNLSEGPHHIVLYAIGNNLVTAHDEAYFVVDLTPPLVTLISPSNTTYETFTIPIVWYANESVHDTEYSLNAGERVAIGGNSTLSFAVNGVFCITFYAEDNAGNLRNLTTVFTVDVDVEPPSILHNPTKSANEGQDIVLYVQAIDNKKLEELTLSYRKAGQNTYEKLPMLPCQTCVNAYNATIPGSEVTKDIEYYINVSDGRNTVTHPSAHPDTSPNLIKVNLKPMLLHLANATQLGETSLLISWSSSADEDFKNYTVYRSTSQASVGTPVYTSSTRTSTTCNVTGLAADTTYYFIIRVHDTGGLYTDSNQVSARTLTGGWLSVATLLTASGALLAVAAIIIAVRRRYIRTPESPKA